jgi:hypothetical protein
MRGLWNSGLDHSDFFIESAPCWSDLAPFILQIVQHVRYTMQHMKLIEPVSMEKGNVWKTKLMSFEIVKRIY